MSDNVKMAAPTMKKYYAFIVLKQAHFYALGRHPNTEAADMFARNFCEVKQTNELMPQLLWIFDEYEYRRLIGEVIKPYVILIRRNKPEVEEEIETNDEAAITEPTLVAETVTNLNEPIGSAAESPTE